MERRRPTQDKLLLYMQSNSKAARKHVLRRRTGLSEYSLNAALTRLRKRGLVRLWGRKYWQINEEGRSYVVKVDGKSTNSDNNGDTLG